MTEALLLKALILGGVAFVMVTLVLYALADHMGRDLARYNLIRGARLKREEYLREIERRRGFDPEILVGEFDDEGDDPYNVDVIEDEPPLQRAA